MYTHFFFILYFLAVYIYHNLEQILAFFSQILSLPNIDFSVLVVSKKIYVIQRRFIHVVWFNRFTNAQFEVKINFTILFQVSHLPPYC